ncbi:TPA: TetR/AcrR family transcriptional regulator [Serratia marcescens]|uniref:TetR/AcrR family transcriptional regulator n=1 Tax=Serratia ureilytica TaxID=300181 RepID=UPI0018D90652|nr:TetR/AcrR family transcriptional regulator [Serratia ureilytica]MBH3319133.1 TetR/AcrR family transcriptional regulator [Serratia ureilytica]
MILSPAAKKVSDAAVIHFSEKGFDVGSLNSVADAAGIKKPTIYSHFRNKHELFLHIINESVAIETAFVRNCFEQDEQTGHCYLSEVIPRFHESPHLRLLLRTAFSPPESLKSQISKYYESFLKNIHEFYSEHMLCKYSSGTELFADAYLGIVDSVHVELIYATTLSAEVRRNAMWTVFSLALHSTHKY